MAWLRGPAWHAGRLRLDLGGTLTSSMYIRSPCSTDTFSQAPPQHENPFVGDLFLQRNLGRLLPAAVLDDIRPDLHRFGERVRGEIWQLGQECERQPPQLESTDAWGQRVDRIVTSPAWRRQKVVAAEEGLIAIAYERTFEQWSRLYQTVKLSLYSPASGLYSCPLAMTDGAAKTIESRQLGALLSEPWRRLTSRDPDTFWTSGQWMTEKRGGSDVADGTATVAVPSVELEDVQYRLHGYKWFSSATDADMTLTLARIVNGDGTVPSGSAGLSMFFLETRDEAGRPNGFQVAKLKNKLGTRQLPTGELLLDGACATLISPPGRGVACISSMLTVTRLHNVISSVSTMRKMTSLARDYATRRRSFGRRLDEHVLHVQTLCRMETEARGGTVLMLELARMLGLDDCGSATEEEAMVLRLVLPVAKMYTAKKAVAVASEGLECFGGQGYIEDTGLPGLFRDAQVLPIWEGTSNVLSLDLLRTITKTKGEALRAFRNRVVGITELGADSTDPTTRRHASEIQQALLRTLDFVGGNGQLLERSARDLSFSLAHIYIAALLLEHSLTCREDAKTLAYWLEDRNLSPVVTNHGRGVYETDVTGYKEFVYDGYDHE